MMTKKTDPVAEKRSKWAAFEELLDTNENLDEACSILFDLQQLIRKLPNMCGASEDAALLDAVVELDSLLDTFAETTGVYFDDIEFKLDTVQKSLLHDDCANMNCFSKTLLEVRCTQKLIDTLISNAEEEVYKFLENEDLYVDRRKTDDRIMELVLNS